jgi:hypothetical protein
MLHAIQLDDEVGAVAGEIRNVVTERRLPAEMETERTQGAELAPEDAFGSGGMFA